MYGQAGHRGVPGWIRPVLSGTQGGVDVRQLHRPVPHGGGGRGRRDGAARGMFLGRRRPGQEPRRDRPAAHGRRPVLGQPRRERGPAGRRVHQGRQRQECRPDQEDRPAAGRRVDRPGQPRGRDQGLHRGGREGRPGGAAGPLQHPAPRLRPVLEGRRRRRQRVPRLAGEGRQGHRRPPGHGDSGAGRSAAPGRRLHPTGVPRGAVRPPQRRRPPAEATAAHPRLHGRGQCRLADARRALPADPAGRHRGRGRLRGQCLQLPDHGGQYGFRQAAVGEGRREAVRDRHQPQRQRALRRRRPEGELVQPSGPRTRRTTDDGHG